MSSFEMHVTPIANEVEDDQGDQILVELVNDKEDITAYLVTLLQKERFLHTPCPDYIAKIRSMANSSDVDLVNEKWRRKLCEWCYEVTDHFKFDREVVSYALNYLDRSAYHWIDHSQTLITKREYQLLAVTSLYMAIKIHGETDTPTGPRRKLKIDAFCELSRKQFDVTMIEDTERYILSALNWNINPPTALKCIATFLSLCPRWELRAQHTKHASIIGGIYDVARYLSELAVCQSDFSFTCNISTVAFASILFAMDTLQSTMVVPYVVRCKFLRNIAQATGLVPGNADVIRAYEMLKKICPGMIATPEERIPDASNAHSCTEHAEDVSLGGKSSPICVMTPTEQHQQEKADIDTSQRKRSRSIGTDNWRPIERSTSA